MKGIWKTKISGWNQKGLKRKKQTRKHLIKDNIKPLIKRGLYKDIALNENTYKNYSKINGYVKTKRYEVKYIKRRIELWEGILKDEKNLKEKIIYAYKINKIWYNEANNIQLPYSKIFKPVKFITYLNKHDIYGGFYEEKKYIKASDFILDFYKKEDIHLYKKPLEKDFYNIYGFYASKSNGIRQFGKKYVNSKDRTNLRIWLAKKDYDSEIKTHEYSKSIDRWVS